MPSHSKNAILHRGVHTDAGYGRNSYYNHILRACKNKKRNTAPGCPNPLYFASISTQSDSFFWKRENKYTESGCPYRRGGVDGGSDVGVDVTYTEISLSGYSPTFGTCTGYIDDFSFTPRV